MENITLQTLLNKSITVNKSDDYVGKSFENSELIYQDSLDFILTFFTSSVTC